MEKTVFWKTLMLAHFYLSVSGKEEDIHNDILESISGVGQISYQTSLHLNYNDEFLCGGIIVSPTKVLTLAHCLYYSWGGVLPPIVLRVKSGGNSIYGEDAKNYDVTEITFHQHFDSALMQYDLAVIKVSDKFPSNFINKISLTKDVSASWQKCLVTGWNQESGNLSIVEVKLAICDTAFNKKICTQNVNENDTLCKHSLGSSLVCDNKLLGLMFAEPTCRPTDELTVFEKTENAIDLVGDIEEDNSTSSSINVTTKVQNENFLNAIFVLFSFILNLFF